MARLKSREKREAIVESAIEMVAEKGLGASTAEIAKRAGVAHGSLFNYFETKTALFNAVYLHLKQELNDVVMTSVPDSVDTRVQLHHLWTRWMEWGTSKASRRRALAQLSVSDQITDQSRAASAEQSAVGIEIVQRAGAAGALKDQNIEFVGSLIDAFAGSTIDFMIRDPARATVYRESAFEALWRALR